MGFADVMKFVALDCGSNLITHESLKTVNLFELIRERCDYRSSERFDARSISSVTSGFETGGRNHTNQRRHTDVLQKLAK